MGLTVAAAARAARSPGPDAHLPLLRNLHRHLAAARPREERKWLAGGSGYKGRGATTRRCATATLASAHGKRSLAFVKAKSEKKGNLATRSVGGTGSANLILVPKKYQCSLARSTPVIPSL